MNEDILHGKWVEVKGEIQKIWGDVSGDELEKAKGNMTSISGLIEQKYGHKKDEISKQLNSIIAKFKEKIN
jgi:uncharacterized protein YjbJ (UPF0337 family)